MCLVNPQNGSWVLFTISRTSLFRGLLYWGWSVLIFDIIIPKAVMVEASPDKVKENKSEET